MIANVLIAAASAAFVTCVELAYRQQRHPFGDRRHKALAWWAAVVTIDGIISVALLLGLVATDAVAMPDDKLNSLAKAAVLGILGPLALRSPIRKTKIDGEDEQVGITYIYDKVRYQALYALDERLVRLRRVDVRSIRVRWIAAGVQPQTVADELLRHLEEYRHLPDDIRQQAADATTAALSFPTDEAQLEAIIKILRTYRFRSLIDHFSSYTSPQGAPPDPALESNVDVSVASE